MKNKAYTLIEMASVLVIVSLLLGGIVASNGFIKQGKIRKVINDVNIYITAARNFRGIYGYYPGDLPNATSYFGATDVNGNAIANGDGDGYIFCGTECLYSWQELALAGLIPGVYNNSTWSLTANYMLDLQVVSFLFQSVIATIYNIDASVLMSLKLTASSTTVGYSPMTLYLIDKKIDDGSPSSGSMLTYVGAVVTPACVLDSAGGNAQLGTTLLPATYNTATNANVCVRILFNF